MMKTKMKKLRTKILTNLTKMTWEVSTGGSPKKVEKEAKKKKRAKYKVDRKG